MPEDFKTKKIKQTVMVLKGRMNIYVLKTHMHASHVVSEIRIWVKPLLSESPVLMTVYWC